MIVPKGPINNKLALSIDSCTGLVPYRWQIITWSNVVPDISCHLASLALNTLNFDSTEW